MVFFLITLKNSEIFEMGGDLSLMKMKNKLKILNFFLVVLVLVSLNV